MPEPIESLDRKAKWWLLIVSAVTLVILVVAALSENFLADWYQYQNAYGSLLQEKATGARGETIAQQFAVHIKQNVLPDLDRTDRCTTCHAGVDDPRMVDQAQPFTTHPGTYLLIHDPSTFGCTVCHQGQGRATEIVDAHGRDPHWEFPLLEKDFMKTACTRCHSEADLFGEDGRTGLLFRADSDGAGRSSGELVLRGRRLAEERGCFGCHAVNGRGGTLGPDITHVGDKTRHEFDFSHFDRDEPREIEHWLRKHFLEPSEISPGTLMPDLGLSEHEAKALTAYMLSLRKPVVPAAYHSRAAVAEADGRPPETGRGLYAMNCSSCHGPDGRESDVPGIRTPALNNLDALATASDDYYRHIISEGRSASAMPAWGPKGANLSVGEIDRIVGFIRSWEPAGADIQDVSAKTGDPVHGRSYYDGLCGNCHGRRGEGGIGNALNSATFLAIASDRFLAETIVNGRPGTAMAAWKNLSSQAVSDILAYIRTWEKEPPAYREVAAKLAVGGRKMARNGSLMYRGRCASCHGDNGEGGLGPRLNTRDLMRVVDDRYLYRAITEGRPGTAMPAWRHLNSTQIASILSFMKSWQPGPKLKLDPAPSTGDYQLGEVHYRVSCQECHGDAGGGLVGPQLVNPVLLSSASDAVLYHWIGRGRTGSAMKGFLGEEHGPTRLTRDQIADVIAYLRFQGSSGPPPVVRISTGDPNLGRQLFKGSCASCHGVDGEGASGPQLNNPVFLKSASDGFLSATIILGRMGTAMQSMVHGMQGLGQVSVDRVPDIIAHMRQWEAQRDRKPHAVAEMSPLAISAGKVMYGEYCSGCHGPNGRGERDGFGYFAPALNNREFLEAASDGFLLATIARGRSRTPMRPFGEGAGGIVSLKSEAINQIVSYIRTWEQ